MNKNETIFNNLRKIDNQIEALSYICAGLNYEYEDLNDKTKFNSNVDIPQTLEIISHFRNGLKISKKDIVRIADYCKNYDFDFTLYISATTFEEMEKELESLKAKRLQIENEFRKKIKRIF